MTSAILPRHPADDPFPRAAMRYRYAPKWSTEVAAMAVTASNAAPKAATSAQHHAPKHAVCVTGLQRSYPEISHNLHYSLSHLYSGWRHGGDSTAADVAAARASEQQRLQQRSDALPRSRRSLTGHGEHGRGGWSLGRNVAFFGVRPANDSWATVRTDLPPLVGESIQTPCGPSRPAWFSAYAKTNAQRVTYGNSFVQSLCDLRDCLQLVEYNERRVGRQFLTLARLRLDLAWETPLTMPQVLQPNVVYTARMNTKAGVNDKWAIGRRAPMLAYLTRVQFIEKANRLYNRTAASAALRASIARDGLLHYECPQGSNNKAFVCHPRRIRGAEWQHESAAQGALNHLPQRRRFVLTSESFLHWALWRQNVSVGYDPSWMFCKFGNSINTTSRICVPRMRKRRSCGSLVCQGGLTDCFCQNTTCLQTQWYCENVAGKQLSLDPWDSSQPALY